MSPGSQPDPQYVGFFAFCLACVAALCGWHARNQDRRRAALVARLARRPADRLPQPARVRGALRRRAQPRLAHGRPLGLVMLDLDHFKEINDTRGHAAGDDVLRWAVDVMSDAVRPMDTVGRIGGDEFAVVVPGAGPDDSAAVARRLQTALADAGTASVGGRLLPDRRGRPRRAAALRRRRALRGQARPRAPIKLTAKELSWATALARAVDERMAVQHEHSWKVAEYCVAIARRLGWPERELELLQMAAILHDVGKVSIPDHILRKREPLTEREWEAIRQNPVRGAEMVSRIQGLEAIVPWIRHSHERSTARLSGRPERRRDPARLPHPARGRRLRRDDQRPALPAAACRARGAGRAAAQRRHAVRPRVRRGARRSTLEESRRHQRAARHRLPE